MATEELKGSHNFLLEVAGATAEAGQRTIIGGFKSMSGMDSESGGRRDIVLVEGYATTDELWNWRESIASRRAVPKTVTVKKFDTGGRVQQQWTIRRSLLTQFQAPPYSAAGGIPPIASLTIEGETAQVDWINQSWDRKYTRRSG